MPANAGPNRWLSMQIRGAAAFRSPSTTVDAVAVFVVREIWIRSAR
jgi:hypothetical protein